MEMLGRMIYLYLLVLVTESIAINVFYRQIPPMPGDFPLDSYGFSARIPFFSSLFVAIILSIVLSNVPLSLFKIF